MDAPVLSCEGLSKSYGNIPVLQDLRLTLHAGETVGILAPEGYGKTTLIKLIAGLLVPSVGRIEIDGNAPSVATRGIISYLPSECALPKAMNTEELVAFYTRMFADFEPEKAKALLKALRVSTVKPIKALTRGTRKKVELILTMSRKAKCYLLDEPIGEDPAAREYILNTIFETRAENSCILIASSLASEIAPHLDTAYFLKDGKLSVYESSGDEALGDAYGRMFSC